MGKEAICEARYGDRMSVGKALLETRELIFRGEFRLSIPLESITTVEARCGCLEVVFSGGSASFALGPQAEKWALKMRCPRSLLDKLEVKPDSRVAVMGVADTEFHKDLTVRCTQITQGTPRKDTDIVFFGAEMPCDFARLAVWTKNIKPNGSIWVVYPKARSHITQADVMTAGKSAGLVDVKTVSFSETHTGLKFVIPLARRKARSEGAGRS